MYRVAIQRSTGKLIEMQSGGYTHPSPDVDDTVYAAQNLQVMRDNAVAAGYAIEDIEVKFVDEAQWNQIKADDTPVPGYRDLRAREYPPIADYLDGIVKGDQAQIDKYIADCLAVKAKYPKT